MLRKIDLCGMELLGHWHELEVFEIDRDFVYLTHPEGLTEEVEKEVKNKFTMEPEIEMETRPVLIPMAHNQTTRLIKEKSTVRVFLYNKKDGVLAASMKEPLVELNKFAYLRIVGGNTIAHFADIGLDADLFIHKREEGLQPELNKKYIVTMRKDRMTGKLNGDLDLERFLEREGYTYEKEDKVNCQIIGRTESGFKINVEDKHWGYLREQDAVSHTKMCSRFIGYVEDNKQGSLIISMQPKGEKSVKDAAHRLLLLVQEKKYLRLTTDSDPEEIKLRLKMSKNNFKLAIDSLEKKNLIKVTKRGIKLKKED